MAKVIIATTTCQKYLHKIELIKKTWYYQDNNTKHLFFIGGDREKKEDNLITLQCNDSYKYLTQKTRKLFEYLLEKEDFDFLVKTNDDSYVDMQKFYNTDFYNFDYGGFICNKKIIYEHNELPNSFYEIDHKTIKCDKMFLNGKTFCYGAGGFYFISKQAIKCCLESVAPCTLEELDCVSFEDLAVSVLLHNNFKNLKILYLNHNPKIDLPYDISEDGISFHPIHYSLMKDLYANKHNFDNQITLLKHKSYLSDYLK